VSLASPIGRSLTEVRAAAARHSEEILESRFDFSSNPRRATLRASPFFELPSALSRNAKLVSNLLQRAHFAVETEATGVTSVCLKGPRRTNIARSQRASEESRPEGDWDTSGEGRAGQPLLSWEA
jgi:hypothetical protein